MKTNQKQKLAMNLNLVVLFCLGAFFSFLSYLVTTLEDKGINKDNYKAVLLVLFLKSSLGGVKND